MSIVTRAIRIPYNLVLRRAPSPIKRLLWDREFSSGKWNFLDDTAGDWVYSYVEKYGTNGSILDLGCGPGNTANELAPSYRSYLGVDISDVALAKACSRTRENGRADKNNFQSGDLITYVPSQRFDVIMFRESIYHISLREVKATLERYATYLTNTGVFVVRVVIGDSYSCRAKVSVIEKHFKVVEKGQHGKSTVVLVFTPKRPAA